MIGGDMICLDVMYLDICLFCGLHHLPVTASCCGVLLSRLVKHSCHCHWNDWHICGIQLCVCTRLNERNWTVSRQLALLCWRSNSCNHEWLLWATVNCVVAVSIITVCTPFNGIIRSSDCGSGWQLSASVVMMKTEHLSRSASLGTVQMWIGLWICVRSVAALLCVNIIQLWSSVLYL